MPADNRNTATSAQLHHCAARPIGAGCSITGQPYKSGECRVCQKVCDGHSYFGQCLDLEQEVDGRKRITAKVPEGLLARGALCPRKQAFPNLRHRKKLCRSPALLGNAPEFRESAPIDFTARRTRKILAEL